MTNSSEESLLLRIRALESALSKCKRHRMINAYYTRPQTKPHRPTHHDNDTLQIWITSTSYVNYYQNIAHRLEGLKNLYESERLNTLGFRFPASRQVTLESFTQPETDGESGDGSPDDDYETEDESTERSCASGTLSEITSIASSPVTSVVSSRERKRSRSQVSGKCPKNRNIAPQTMAIETTYDRKNGENDQRDSDASDMSLVLSQDFVENGLILNSEDGSSIVCDITAVSTSFLSQSDFYGFQSPHHFDYGNGWRRDN